MCRHLLCATIVAAMLTACHRTSPTRPSLPRPTVTVTSAQADTLAHRQKFIGILQSNYDAVIQPRINGFLASTNYDSGMPVRRGQVLFTIDPTPQSTQLLSARTQLQSAEAKAIEALNNYRRAQPLAKIDAISLSQLRPVYRPIQGGTRRCGAGTAGPPQGIDGDGLHHHLVAHRRHHRTVGRQRGRLHRSRHSVRGADHHLQHRHHVGAGSLPMSEYLSAQEREDDIYDNQHFLSDITLQTADGEIYPYKGIYDFTQKDIDSSTGTLIIVVKFPNPQKVLKPKQFARIEADMGRPRRYITLPQRCVSQQQDINTVWVMPPDSVVRQRMVVWFSLKIITVSFL